MNIEKNIHQLWIGPKLSTSGGLLAGVTTREENSNT